ncbi:hypothetical protein GOP47_0025550 [Adiantum capillus-veneris]|uniref:Uncharacterized protein n=1 Tax=Adiantum capillus-veneris TaxID=13818 RepID=A0A9D4Z481_ADICA|nr:hypothetical protein GOP47_0025550 [Adiantum capillus-veneris]
MGFLPMKHLLMKANADASWFRIGIICGGSYEILKTFWHPWVVVMIIHFIADGAPLRGKSACTWTRLAFLLGPPSWEGEAPLI